MRRRLRAPALLFGILAAVGTNVRFLCATEAVSSSLAGVLAVPAPEHRNVPLKDPFQPSLPAPARNAETPKEPELPPLHLTAILQGPGRAAAVVNGTILRLGDSFLGMKVLGITKNQVLFQWGEKTVGVVMQEKLYNSLSGGGE